MADSVEDLTGTCWRDDMWLQCYGIHPANVLDYFAMSPFYDRACNNEIAKMRNLRYDQMIMLGSGFEYALQDAQPPHLFVIRRLFRKDFSTEVTQAFYYVLDGTVYQAPTLYAVLHTRLQRCRFSFQQALKRIHDDLHPLDSEIALDGSLRSEVEQAKRSNAQRPTFDGERLAVIDGSLRSALAEFPLPTPKQPRETEEPQIEEHPATTA